MSSRSTAALIGRPQARGPNLIYTRRLYAEGSLIFAAMARALSQWLPPRESRPKPLPRLCARISILGSQSRAWWKMRRQVESTGERLRAERWRSMLMEMCHSDDFGELCSLEAKFQYAIDRTESAGKKSSLRRFAARQSIPSCLCSLKSPSRPFGNDAQGAQVVSDAVILILRPPKF